MRSIARNGSHEIEVQRSRFVCSLARVQTGDQAAAVIAAVRRESWNATHHCTAFRLGANGGQQRSSDDGEPAGTAGVPMLEVLTRRDVTDTVAVVTRYYGGIKLGAGGLIRTYGRSVAEAIDAVGTVRRVPHTEVLVTADHAVAGRLDNDLRSGGHRLGNVRYADDVEFTVLVPSGQVPEFSAWLADHSCGTAKSVLGANVLIDVPE